jgi:hypothetical protein
MACICGPGLMGDGQTCVDRPTFETNDLPADVASGTCTPTTIDAGPAHGTIAGSPIVYCLQAQSGVSYTITVGLETLSDSVVELYSSTAMLDSNDDFGGSLGSQLEWTAPSTGRFFVLVRGYNPRQGGDFTLNVVSSNAGHSPPPPPGGAGADCIGCYWQGTCRALADNPAASPDRCEQNGGVWQGAGSPCDGGVTLNGRSGSISFADTYSDRASCSWTVTCPRGQTPTLVFSAFDTETGFDFVNVYPGTTAGGAGLTAPMSGHSLPVPNSIASPQQSMTVSFTSDGSVTGPGFAADYNCGRPTDVIPPPPAPGGMALAVPSHITGSITTGGQTAQYTMQAQAGSTYTLSATPGQGNAIRDTYITVYDAASMTELAHDDDGGDGTSALLTWTCPATASYIVEVRGFNRRQTGTFELDAAMAGGGPGGGGGNPCQGGLQLAGSGAIAFSDGSYVNNAQCSWTVSCADRQHVNFHFTSLDTEANFDWVEITDGQGGPSLTRLSGNMAQGALQGPTEVQTGGPSGVVTMTTDGSVTHGGFDLAYECSAGGAGPAAGCNPIRIGSRPVQGTVTPAGPAQYCITVDAGSTYELTVDLLTLRDSVMSIMDPNGQQIERNDDDGGSLASHLIWTAPASGTYTVEVTGFGSATGDFTLEVQSVGGGGDGTGQGNPCACGITLTMDSSSFDFDDSGVIGATCDWTIRCAQGNGVQIAFDSLNVEQNFDYVTVYDGTSPQGTQLGHFSGSAPPPPITTTSHSVLIEYTSDGSVNRGGFSGSYTCGTTQIAPGGGTSVTPDSAPVQGTVTGADGVRYSMTANGGTTYQIEVTLGSLSDSVLELYAPNGRDMLVSNDDYGGTLSSYIEWTCPSDGQYFVLVRGFSARNTGDFTLSVTTDGGNAGGGGGDPCDGGLSMNVPSAVISYQPRGQYENNANCVWAITCPNRGDVPSFTFTALDTENGFDFVQIEDGNAITAGSARPIDQVSGNLQSLDRVSYSSGSQSMTIEFSTDGSVTGVGFEGSYACGSPPNPGATTCTDTMEELNGRGACAGFLGQGFSCAQRFCPTCTFASMCDATCGFCGGGTVGNECATVNCNALRGRACRNQDGCCTWDGSMNDGLGFCMDRH